MPKVVPEYKEEARERIMDAAKQVFAEKGYHEATMDEVAKRLGVSKGALYLYFSSKEELFEALCRKAPNAFKDILHSTFNDGQNPFGSAAQFFDRMMQRFGSSPRLGFEILSEAVQNPRLRQILKQNQDEYARVLVGFMENLHKMRIIDNDVELLPLAYSLIGLWNGLETLVVSGLPVADARRAWLTAFRVIFLPKGYRGITSVPSPSAKKTR